MGVKILWKSKQDMLEVDVDDPDYSAFVISRFSDEFFDKLAARGMRYGLCMDLIVAL